MGCASCCWSPIRKIGRKFGPFGRASKITIPTDEISADINFFKYRQKKFIFLIFCTSLILVLVTSFKTQNKTEAFAIKKTATTN